MGDGGVLTGDRLRLAFMGSPEFAVPALAALIDAGHDLLAVYAQPPRPAGRGQRPRLSPVHAYAERHGLSVRTPATLRTAEAGAEFAALDLDAAVVAAYGLILPRAILEAPRLGCFNIHASLLPRWRGAAPIQRALLAGDDVTGVTIMRMDEGLDTGPMLLAERLPIGPDATAGALHDQLAALGARLIVTALAGLAQGRLKPIPQPREGVTYAPKLARDEGRIDWRRPAAEIERMARAFDPWPGAWFEHRSQRIKLLAATVEEGESGAAAARSRTAGAPAVPPGAAPGAPGLADGPTRALGVLPPGTVLDDALRVACGEGVLCPRVLQRPGRAPLPVEAFLRGYPLPAGTRLG